MGKTPPKEKEADGSPRNKAPRVDDDSALIKVPVASAPSPTGKTPPKGEEAEGSPRKKAPRVDDSALVKVPVVPVRSPTGKTPPKGEEAEGSPRKKAPRLDDASLVKVPVVPAPSPTGKTPPKGEEAEGSPRKIPQRPRSKSPRRQDRRPAAGVPLPTVPESSELIGEGDANGEKRCKCNHVVNDHAIQELTGWMNIKDAWTCCGCQREEIRRIVKTRPEKRDLLICVTCYDHLCCGVGSIAYPFGHSRAHCLKKKHWFALLYYDPERGYCFKCNAEVPMPVKFGDVDHEIGLDLIRSIVNFKLLNSPQSVGQTEAVVKSKKVEMMGKVQVESRPSEFGVDLEDRWPSYESRSSNAQGYSKVQAGSRPSGFDVYPVDKWHSYESRSSDAQGYAIRGIPNQGNTCYMSAVLQCLFVLGKLQERMLALDRPESDLAKALKKLFVEASAAGNVLNPTDVLECLWSGKAPFSRPGAMEDSHELLMALRHIWKKGESDDPTMMDSIFQFQMTQTKSCRKCGHSSGQKIDDFWDLSVHFPSKWHPTKSAASPQTSESPRSRKMEIAVQLFPADVQRNLEKMQTVSESAYSHAIGSEVIVEETHKPLEVDSTQAQNISQSKDDVHSPVRIQEGKSVDSLTEDSVSVEDLLLLFSEGPIEWSCPDCGKDHEEPSTSRSKNGGQRVGSGNADNVGDTVHMYRFTTLPPVLTLHLNRTSYQKITPMVGNKDDNTVAIKISVHVRFMEYLDVERFMDRSSVDKGSTLYRLAGVVEHSGEGSLKSGHYIAYTRARRLGNQQEGNSCSSSWFRADDHRIRKVTLEQVLNSKAYIIFYERMEGQDISGT